MLPDWPAGYGNHEIECGEEVEMSGMFAWQIGILCIMERIER